MKFICQVLQELDKEDSERRYNVSVSTTDILDIPKNDTTIKIVYSNSKLPVDSLIYAYNTIFNKEEKKVTIVDYAKVILQDTQAPEKEIAIGSALSEKIREMISNSNYCPVDLFK